MNSPGSTAARYDRVAIAFHWGIALLLLAQIAFGFLLDEIAPRNTPARAGVINLHKSCGIVLGLLIVARLAWRLAHRPPPYPPSLAPGEQRAARVGQRLLYAGMVAMPLSGYIASNFSKYGVRFFGFTWKPWGAELPSVYAFFNGVHIVSAFLLTALIAGHVALALKHRLVDRDGVLARMWPGAAVPEPLIDAPATSSSHR